MAQRSVILTAAHARAGNIGQTLSAKVNIVCDSADQAAAVKLDQPTEAGVSGSATAKSCHMQSRRRLNLSHQPLILLFVTCWLLLLQLRVCFAAWYPTHSPLEFASWQHTHT